MKAGLKRVAVLLALLALAAAGVQLYRSATAPVPALVAGLPDDGLRGAPCPARSILEQNARLKRGAPPPAAFGEKLRRLFPLGSDAGPLEARLKTEGFDFFSPCPNDESVSGARWLSRSWGQPDAYVYWRADEADKLNFLDGHVVKAN
ncbi:hypothetical protein [Rhodoblastus sp.]|uniref:hypothetical protein n=1 Tax=Rhodoblastus sp. TaxID=1962975 RepID=UPI002621735F|nr:hypothetical protein [Rhodoblastus sp.]